MLLLFSAEAITRLDILKKNKRDEEWELLGKMITDLEKHLDDIEKKWTTNKEIQLLESMMEKLEIDLEDIKFRLKALAIEVSNQFNFQNSSLKRMEGEEVQSSELGNLTS